MFYCGTSNIVLPVKNKSFYPPEFQLGSRLNYYASIFNSLEVNQTFYKLPLAKTIAKWREEAPDAFRFTMKLGKEITHCKELNFDSATLSRYMEVFSEAGAKKGCLLIQLPGGTKAGLFFQFEYLLTSVHELNDGWKLAVEFRDPSWYNRETYALLEASNALLVEHDMPASATPVHLPKSNTRYFRFHGEQGDYRGSYSDEVLKRYAAAIKEAELNGQDVYAYFNNTIGDAVQNALSLQRYYFETS